METMDEKRNQSVTESVSRKVIWWKVAAAFIICCIVIAVSIHLTPKLIESDTGQPNPIKQTDSISELKDSVQFELYAPTQLPEGFQASTTSVIADQLAQISYKNGEAEILYRTAEGADDISGDYNSYDFTSTEPFDSGTITLKGNGDLVYLALWNSNGLTYSLSFSEGAEKNIVLAVAGSLDKV